MVMVMVIVMVIVMEMVTTTLNVPRNTHMLSVPIRHTYIIHTLRKTLGRPHQVRHTVGIILFILYKHSYVIM